MENSSPKESSHNFYRPQRLVLLALGSVFLVLVSIWTWKRFFAEVQEPLKYASFVGFEPDPLASNRSSWDAPEELNQRRGRVTAVSFWAQDCVLCFEELNQLSQLAQTYRKWDFKVIAVELPKLGAPLETEDETQGRIESIRERILQISDIDFIAVGSDVSLRIELLQKTFESPSVPATALVDSEGRVALRSTGANDWMSPESLQLIEELIVESRPDLHREASTEAPAAESE